MITIQNSLNGKETELANGAHIYLKDGEYEVYKEWAGLTPSTQEALSEIASQVEELRTKSVELLKDECPAG